MNTTYIIIIIASISILVILAITSIRKKAKLRDVFINTFDFNNNDFVVIKEKKEYERQGKVVTEFIWVNKDSGYLTITIGLNFILKDRYKNLDMLEYLKFSNKFLKKYKKEDYQILGQDNTILIKEIEVKNKTQIPTVNRIDNILTDLSKVIDIEKLKP